MKHKERLRWLHIIEQSDLEVELKCAFVDSVLKEMAIDDNRKVICAIAYFKSPHPEITEVYHSFNYKGWTVKFKIY